MRCPEVKTMPCRNCTHRKGGRASLVMQKCKCSTKLFMAPSLQAFTSDADVKSKVSKHGASCPGDSQSAPALEAPFYFHPAPRRKKVSSGSWHWDKTSARGDRREGKALGSVTAVRVLARDRTLRELLHLSSASVTEARVQTASS